MPEPPDVDTQVNSNPAAVGVNSACSAQADMKAEPRMAEDGRLWTPGAVDFFRTVNEQVRMCSHCLRTTGPYRPLLTYLSASTAS